MESALQGDDGIEWQKSPKHHWWVHLGEKGEVLASEVVFRAAVDAPQALYRAGTSGQRILPPCYCQTISFQVLSAY